ncbi:hypothetical protein LSTR_LSTR000312 [Laodelphax striatellus]|uniref:Ectonucleotide pyrophosphatase/phosphodiesterase family member 5 n=1 Tax=Laodelphax striatellus TaxID=195883 RepID=A0A482X800_LAOST|nr:hypothetical protein LSTR_LSTR000312 [Laodelphax striatellus]
MSCYFIFIFIAQYSLPGNYSLTSDQTPLIVISLDGFWYKYFERNVTPTISRLRDEGVSAPYLINIFPTKTFTNHFSIVTGQFAEEHHVLDNTLFDPVLNRTVTYSEELFTRSQSAVPIWVINEKSGNSRYSGVMMWPGCNYRYLDSLPTHLRTYRSEQNYRYNVDRIVQWMTNETHPANLIFMYLDFPDARAHRFGPDSSEVEEALKEVDNTVLYLQQKLDEFKIHRYNLIVLSDHGMASVRYGNMINLTDILTIGTYDLDGASPTLGVFPKSGYEDEVASKLKEAANELNFNFYTRDDIPEDWHYKKSYRAPPILLVARQGYFFQDKNADFISYSETNNKELNEDTIFGMHGYDPADESMHAIFIANGPSFKKRHVVKPFRIVDLFSLFAYILRANIDNYLHSGDFKNVEDLLAVDKDDLWADETFSIED